MERFVLALDQGTTSSRTLAVNHLGLVVAQSQLEFPQIYPTPGHVEHDPEAIWESQLTTARQAISKTPGAWRRSPRSHHEPAGNHDSLGSIHREADRERHRLAEPNYVA